MIRLLTAIHSFFYSKNEVNKYKSTNRIMWFISSVIFRLCEYQIYYTLKLRRLFGGLPERLDRNGNIIVSLTSFPARIEDVWMVIDSMMRQSVRPNRIVLNLTRDEFPNGELPKSLDKYIELGLEVVYRVESLRSHLKYHHVIKENPDSIVITVDDDLYYQDDVVERLVTLHNAYPGAVCANKVRTISFDNESHVNPYLLWEMNQSMPFTPSHRDLALGVCGVLYPTNLFVDSRMFDVDMIKEHCLRADDLWLKAFEIINDIPVVTGKYYCFPPELIGSQRVSLKATNCDDANPQNDVQWRGVNVLYGVNKLLRDENIDTQQ